MLVNYTLYTLFHLHFPYSLIVHITTYFLSITYNCPLLPTILFIAQHPNKFSLTQVSNNSLLCNILTSLTHASFQQFFIAQHPNKSLLYAGFQQAFAVAKSSFVCAFSKYHAKALIVTFLCNRHKTLSCTVSGSCFHSLAIFIIIIATF